MATNSIRVDDAVRDETVRIAEELGLTFNGVVNILLRRFNAEKGFPFAVKLEEARKVSVFDMSSDEFALACKEAVASRDSVPSIGHVTMIDEETGRLCTKYADGRVEYELD